MKNSVMYHDSSAEFEKEFSDKLTHKELINKCLNGKVIEYDWIDFIMSTIPYINKIFENPKRFIVNEEEVLNVEKVKKVTIDTVKHLAKHSNFISEVDGDKIKPSKLLNVFKEETFNTYENRFICTLTDLLATFIETVEEKVQNLDFHISNSFDFNGETTVEEEKITYYFSLKSEKDSNTSKDKEFMEKLQIIKNEISAWRNTAVYKALKKEKAQKVTPPLKRTNVILKNPNFQIAAKLWDFVHGYELEIKDLHDEKTSIYSLPKVCEKHVTNTFLANYYVMKSINSNSASEKKKYEKEINNLNNEMLEDTIESIVSTNTNITKEELLSVVSEHFDRVRIEKVVDYTMISDKIKHSTKDYLDRINQSYFMLGEEYGEQNGEPSSEQSSESNSEYDGEQHDEFGEYDDNIDSESSDDSNN